MVMSIALVKAAKNRATGRRISAAGAGRFGNESLWILRLLGRFFTTWENCQGVWLGQ
jgi:hypothetical protein